MYRVGIVGASGYTGAELLRLCFEHPQLELVWAMGETQAGTEVADLYPSLAAAYPRTRFEPYNASLADGLDLVFLALPHGMSQQLAPDLQRRADKVIDLSADFRLRDASLYPRWYGEAHTAPALIVLRESANRLARLASNDGRPTAVGEIVDELYAVERAVASLLGAIALAADPDLAAMDGMSGNGGDNTVPRAVTDWTTTGVLTPERIG